MFTERQNSSSLVCLNTAGENEGRSRYIDLSIIPENVGADTTNTALIVGEMAADIIAGESGPHVRAGHLISVDC